MSLLSSLLLVAATAIVVQADDEFCEPMFTKQEVGGFANAWCQKTDWIVTFMNRKIECRNKFLVRLSLCAGVFAVLILLFSYLIRRSVQKRRRRQLSARRRHGRESRESVNLTSRESNRRRSTGR